MTTTTRNDADEKITEAGETNSTDIAPSAAYDLFDDESFDDGSQGSLDVDGSYQGALRLRFS
jgi:hypothetical protein